MATSTPGRWIDAHITPRLAPALWLVLIVPLGLIVRAVFAQPIAEHMGNGLWGIMWVAIVWLIAPSWRLMRITVAALVIVWSIELLQMTPIPAACVRAWPNARWLLGTSFAIHDLIGNAIGVLIGAILVRKLADKR